MNTYTLDLTPSDLSTVLASIGEVLKKFDLILLDPSTDEVIHALVQPERDVFQSVLDKILIQTGV